MNAPTLRHQLTDPSAPGFTETGACFRAVDRASGITFCNARRKIAFPYSHLLYADLVCDDTLAVRFSTHRILIIGENVDRLLEEIAGQP